MSTKGEFFFNIWYMDCIYSAFTTQWPPKRFTFCCKMNLFPKTVEYPFKTSFI